MKPWLAPVLTLIVPAACTLAFVLLSAPQKRAAEHASAPPSTPSVEAPPALPRTPAAAAPAPSRAAPPASTEARLKERVRVAYETQAADIAAPRELDRYLDTLEEQARARGAVTAEEVEPGFMAIRRAPYTEDSEVRQAKLSAFSERMANLSSALGAGAATAAPAPALSEIQKASGADREQLIAQYLRASHRLPEDQRQLANQQLNELVKNN